jgi:NRAMP (natural resistance-associated macrophage protein)-like metal ion transporter
MAKKKKPRFLKVLGPGLITGAADDDPSGVSTYTTAGAAFGYALLWTAPFTLPLMIAVQLMCARIGMVAGQGLAGVLRANYPRWALWLCCSLLLIANTVNIGADLAAMAAVMEMLTGINLRIWVPVVALLILALLIFETYPVIAKVFKWLTLVLFAYVLTAFFAHADWSRVFHHTVVPQLHTDRRWLMTFVAIFGTTISPYLFFWQADEEVEEEKAIGRETIEQRKGASAGAIRNATLDVVIGMTISVVIFYFIIVSAAATLNAAGKTEIATAQQAAAALRPLAGNAATILFSLGIIGTGLLGVSVLAGSSALAIAEAADWRSGMSEKWRNAKPFYTVMSASIVVGAIVALLNTSGIRLLFFAAMLNGLLAPPLIIAVIIICNNSQVMGERTNGRLLNAFGALTALVMIVSALVLLLSL